MSITSLIPRRLVVSAPPPREIASAVRYTLPLELEERVVSRRYSRLIQVMCVAFGVFLAWGSLTPIRELTTGKGQIIPLGQVRSVQHYEGGIVAEVLVWEGEQVNKDQPIMRLQMMQAGSELDALKVRLESLSLRKARIEALLSGQGLAAAPDGTINARLAADQKTLFDAVVEQKLRERQTLATQVDQRRSEIGALENEISKGSEMLNVQKQLMDMRQRLATEGFASRKMLLDAQAAMIQAESSLQSSRGRLDAARDALAQAESRLAQADSDARATWSDELSKVSAEWAETQETLQKYNDRVDRLLVRSPVEGTVLQLSYRTPNEVVKPGDVVARVVPAGEQLQAEVQIQPEEIGHINVNDYAELKLAAYDASVYGKIRGKVIEVSPYTFENEQKKLFYRVRIGFNAADTFGGYMRPNIQPGLVVDAQIVTGAKSLIHYMLKPIYRGLDAVFAER